MDYVPFHDRYSYGREGKVVPKDPIHARKLSKITKDEIRRIRGDLAKKPLLDPLTQSPVNGREYSEWRRRAAGAVKSKTRYLKDISVMTRSFKAERRKKKVRRKSSLV